MLTDLDMAVLAHVVEQYDDSQQPVTTADLADVFDADEATLQDALETLATNELLAAIEGGYRPTITARELLALDIDFENSLVVLDFDAPDAESSDDVSGSYQS